VERTELKINAVYRVQDSLHHQKYVLFPREAHYDESAANRQNDDGSVPGDTAECCSVRSVSVATALNLVHFNSIPSSVVLGSDALSAKLHGVT
jgi:hypothetical protein